MDFWIICILSLSIVGVCCYTSFRSGRNEGLQLGIERSLEILIDQKIVYLDEDSEIHQYHKFYFDDAVTHQKCVIV